MNLPYQFIAQHINDYNGDFYFGNVLELDERQSDGKTVEELHTNLREAMKWWLEVTLESREYIPEPLSENSFSGKFI